MNSAALLDLLGNENRRRILRLLAQKPCYVTEISEYLGVSPKAVIDHLQKLEEAGLVESRVDDQRRKYFHIARNLRLEVNVSPYRFGAKSAYPASMSLDLTRWRYLTIDVGGDEDDEADADPDELADRLRRLEDLEDELSMAQRWVQGRLTDTLDQLGEVVEESADAGFDSRLYADVLLAVQDGRRTTAGIADSTGTPAELVEEALAALAEAGLVTRQNGDWRID
ncbi:MarR family transcriptional regulator [Halobacteriales archaeon QS_8_69_26]|nr:MAG: MarR family transcriptional regulator [Halobacteriales archaeon QS_8_69_26]